MGFCKIVVCNLTQRQRNKRALPVFARCNISKALPQGWPLPGEQRQILHGSFAIRSAEPFLHRRALTGSVDSKGLDWAVSEISWTLAEAEKVARTRKVSKGESGPGSMECSQKRLNSESSWVSLHTKHAVARRICGQRDRNQHVTVGAASHAQTNFNT